MHPHLGINVDVRTLQDVNQTVVVLQQLQVSWIRLTFPWREHVDLQKMDDFVRRVRSVDIRILGLLTAHIPGTLRQLFFTRRDDPMLHLESYLSYCESMVKRYGRYIDHWEIWNEQNTKRFWNVIPDPKEYASLLLQASTLIRRIQPQATIVFGGILGNDVDKVWYASYDYVRQALEHGAQDMFDIHNIHPYEPACYVSLRRSEHQYLAHVKRQVSNFRKQYPDRLLWITEYGVARPFVLLSQQAIARLYVRLLAFAQENDCVLFLWHLQDFSSSEYAFYNPEKYFGLLTSSFGMNRTMKEFIRLLEKDRSVNANRRKMDKRTS